MPTKKPANKKDPLNSSLSAAAITRLSYGKGSWSSPTELGLTYPVAMRYLTIALANRSLSAV
ncbi:MAG: hypothetical protein V4702_01025 [Patescibacteria group bacterium]